MKSRIAIMCFILFLITIIFLAYTSAKADGAAQYEVTIHVVYNSVGYDKAASIIREALKQHGSACKVEVTSKKVEDSASGYAITATMCYKSATEAYQYCHRWFGWDDKINCYVCD